MSFRVKKNTERYATIEATSNASIRVTGNSSISDIPTEGKNITGASIVEVQAGSPSFDSAFWRVKRGSNTVLALDSTINMDLRDLPAVADKESSTISAELVRASDNDGYLVLELSKHFEEIDAVLDSVSAARSLVEAYSSDTQGMALMFSGAMPSLYIKDTTTPANDTDVLFTDFDAFNSLLTYTSPSPKIVRQSDGDWKYCAHNLYLNSASPANQAVTVVSGLSYRLAVTGTVSVTLSGASTGTITAAADHEFTAASGTLTFGSTSGSGTVHLHLAPAVETYLETGGSARYALPISYDASGVAEGLLVEPASTNLSNYSTALNSNTTKMRTSISSNVTVSPSGESDADKLVCDGTAAETFLLQKNHTVSSATEYTYSIYAKKDELDFVVIYNSSETKGKCFDLTNGTVGTDFVSPPSEANIVDVGNGWFRCSITFTSSGTAANIFIYLAEANLESATIFDGDSTSGIYLWQSQLESGSVATSPIVTAGSTVTRQKDNLSLATNAFAYGAVSTMYARAVRNDAGANGILEFGDGTSAEFVSLRTLSAGRLSLLVRDSGFPTVDINGSNNVFGVGDDVKVAAAIAADDFIYYVDGSSNGTDNSGTLPTVTTLFIGSTNISSALNGIIKEIGIWPEDVGDANLQAMTS